MRILTAFGHRLRALLLRRRLDAETREELQAHLDRQVALHRASGLSEAEARRAAVLEFGALAPLEEACRDARGVRWWDALGADARYGVRQIRKRPGFSLAAILTLALGIGATSAVFTVVDAILLRPLPYPQPDRLQALFEVNSRSTIGRTRVTALNFLDWRDQSHAFAGMAAHVGTGFTLTGRGDPAFVLGQLVTTNLTAVLGVSPALGRTFRPEESEAGHHRVVVLTHGLWQRQFGGDPSVVGGPTTINGQQYRIVGVMPASFVYPGEDYELLAPLVTQGTVPDAPSMDRSARYLRVVARLADGVDPDAARGELDVIGHRLAQAYPETNETVTIGLTGLAAETIGDAGGRLLVMLAAVAFVLLIACLNVAGLAIARGGARARELAVRMAIGANRGRIIRQLATENLLIFAIGGAAGLVVAALGVDAIASTLPPSVPRAHEIVLDWRFAAFGAAVTLVTGLVFSVLPAIATARRGLAGRLTTRADSASRPTQRTRGILIAAQMASAVVLLTGAGLALRSFDHVRRVDPGFDAAGVVTFSFVMRDNTYPAAADLRAFSSRVTERLDAMPGVEAAGLTTHLPLSDQNVENGFTVEGSPAGDGQDPPVAGVRGVTGDYRAAISARLLQGRDLRPGDTVDAPPVAVVTEGFAARYIRSANPIGVRLKMGGPDSDLPWSTIVGVIADIRHAALDEVPRPEVWFPYAQLPEGLLTRWLRGSFAAVRTSIEPDAAVPALRAAMRELDPELPLRELQQLGDLARASTAERRLETWLLAAFATIATALAAVGLFGVLAFHVAQHGREFGVRLALGAQPSALMRLVLCRGFLLLGAGLALGLPGALLMGRGMASLLYGVQPTDPTTLGASAALLTAVTFLACGLPARRAMKTDPLVALRQE